nr:ATP synthase F0 subunit C [Ornithinimicrobium sediminis]
MPPAVFAAGTTHRKRTDVTGDVTLIGYGLATIGPAIAVGLIFAAYINGVARQPEASNLLRPIAILGFALAEALAIFGLVLFFIRL